MEAITTTALLARIEALEANARTATVLEEDFSDPPLFLTRADGAPVNREIIEKIPDLVKDLPIFTGNPKEVGNWISDTDDLIQLYEPTVNSSIEEKSKFHMICRCIRRKIRGEANDALVASNVNLNWKLIRKTLLTYYGEKRDIRTLDYQLMNCQQQGGSLEEHFDNVNELLSLIVNQINMNMKHSSPDVASALIDSYKDKAIDSFVRGLDGTVSTLLKNYRPDTLAAAYAYCVSYQNTEYRKN